MLREIIHNIWVIRFLRRLERGRLYVMRDAPGPVVRKLAAEGRLIRRRGIDAQYPDVAPLFNAAEQELRTRRRWLW